MGLEGDGVFIKVENVDDSKGLFAVAVLARSVSSHRRQA
jgi:hypothetical protein